MNKEQAIDKVLRVLEAQASLIGEYGWEDSSSQAVLEAFLLLRQQPDGPRWTPVQLAEFFHDTYERLAPGWGWETNEASRVPFDALPEANRNLMVSVCGEVLVALAAQADEPETVECPTNHGRLRRDNGMGWTWGTTHNFTFCPDCGARLSQGGGA